MSSKKLMLVLGVLIAVSMVLSACATPTPQVVKETVVVTQVVEKEGKTTVQEKVVTATPVPPTAAPTKAPAKASDTIVLALQQEPDTLHPLIGSMMARTIVNSTYMPGCVGQNEKAEWIPLGCTTVPTIDNGGAKWVGEGADKHLEVTFKIKDGWRWTDGSPVTAKDAIYAWKLSMDAKFEIAARTLPEKVYDVVSTKPNEFTYLLLSEKQAKDAAAGTLKGNVDFKAFQNDYKDSGYDKQAGAVVDSQYFALGGLVGWLPEAVLGKIKAEDQAKSDYAKKPLGDGPYVVKEWKQGQEIVLEKSDKKFPLGDPKVKTIIFRFFAETPAVIAALKNGEIDAVTTTGGLTVNNAPDLDKIEAAGLYKVNYQPGYAWEHIDLNTTNFPFDDVKVRKAFYLATDKKSLVDKLYFGKQGTTDLPVPPGLSFAFTDKYVKYPFNLDNAKALLKEAGWDCTKNPCEKKDKADKTLKLEFTLMTTDRADRQALAQAIQAMWKKLNAGVNLQFLYGRGLFATCSAGGPLNCRTFQAAIYTWITGDDPQFMGLYDCAGVGTKANNYSGQNYPGFCDKKADELLVGNEVNPETALSREKRKPILEQWFQIWTDQVPVIPLFSNTNVSVYRIGFKGFKPGPTQYAADAWNSWEWELSK
jgi:peptide/nickel transport system substrate-binding protein